MKILVFKKLLDKYDIKSKLISNHKFNEKKFKKIIEILKSGKKLSLICDAGTQVFQIQDLY